MSSASIRIFLVSDGDEIYRVPNTKFDRMLKGSFEENTDRFSGKRVRAAEIAVKIENRKPIQVLRAIYHYLHFNKDGILDCDRLMKDGAIVANAGIPSFLEEKSQGNLINAKKEFAKRQRDNTVWWKPNMQLERNILDASIDEFKCKRL
ncbi:MAG: hypothetical protein GQ542_04380 [Desulforhopalus sp.]|jgi:hypothetical protein|nr:hypothetical protein [Desulforhopalus sp.]